MSEIKAVLLDVDGTLIDSVDAHANAWVDVLREYGYEVPFEKARPLIGMGGDRVLPTLTGLDHESPLGKEISARRGEIFKEQYLPGLRAFPRVRELLTRLRDDGYSLVAASSANVDDLNALLDRAGVRDLMEELTSSDDADKSKPAPDIIEAALKRAGCSAAEAVMVGDTPYDVEAAARAGVRTIGLLCGGWEAEELAGAGEIYDSPSALLDGYELSLLRRGGRNSGV